MSTSTSFTDFFSQISPSTDTTLNQIPSHSSSYYPGDIFSSSSFYPGSVSLPTAPYAAALNAGEMSSNYRGFNATTGAWRPGVFSYGAPVFES